MACYSKAETISQFPTIPGASEEIAQACWQGPIAMAVCDVDGCVVDINDKFDEMLGYGASAVRGKHFRDFTLPSDAQADEIEFRRLMTGEISHYSMVKSWITKSGLTVSGRMHVTRTSHGEIFYSIAQITQEMSQEQMATIATLAERAVRKELDCNQSVPRPHATTGETVYAFCRDQWSPFCVLCFIVFQLAKLIFDG